MSILAIQLQAVLPAFGDATLLMEDRARSILRLLLDRVEDSEQPEIPLSDFHCCPNCDLPSEGLASPYCSENCRDKAAFVRQFRAAIANGSILTAEKQVVFGERLWWLVGGGLPLRESRIPTSARRQVTKRSEGKCECCGAPMTTIENIGSGCNRTLHLRAVCPGCAKTKSFGDLEFSRSSPVVNLLTDFAKRVDAVKPLRACDDPEKWDWRAFLVARRSAGTD